MIGYNPHHPRFVLFGCKPGISFSILHSFFLVTSCGGVE